ncbi:hypothetical protein [Anaerovibrio slackiae]|uniref:hypothetical protein n=1 Tax=Anaerovibrio slackiae TaxID=2652309 RepID=UPI00386E3B6D
MANSIEKMPEYVERSYHEAIVNTLAHRDYIVNGSEVRIGIYVDRMEIILLAEYWMVLRFRVEIHFQYLQTE